jgi:hypothetical protein
MAPAMGKKYIWLFALCQLCLSSCIVISVNENNYALLSKSERTQIADFDQDILSQKRNTENALMLFEINSQDVLNIAKKHPYTWVYLWQPGCSGNKCSRFFGDTAFIEKYKEQGLLSLLISETYDIRQIQKEVNHLEISQPVFVLEDAWFGEKLRPAYRQFMKEVNRNPSYTPPKYGRHLLFQRDQLIFAGPQFSTQILDSLIHLQTH